MNIQFIKNKSKNYARRRELVSGNKKTLKNLVIIVLSLIFFVGIVVGIFYFKNIVDSSFFEENPNILENIDLKYKNDLDSQKMLAESLVRNIIILMFIWIIGLSILGIPILLCFVLYDGFSLGITLSYILTTFGFYKGYAFIYSTMYISTLINTAAMLLLCNSAIKVTVNILKQKTNIKSEFIRHSMVCIIMLTLLIISSIIEVYSTNFA